MINWGGGGDGRGVAGRGGSSGGEVGGRGGDHAVLTESRAHSKTACPGLMSAVYLANQVIDRH